MITFFLLVTLAAVANGQTRFKLGDCPEVPVMNPFEFEQFQGTWYVVSNYEAVSKCVRENVTKVGDEYSILVELETVGIPVRQPASVKFYKNRPESMMKLSYPKSYDLSDENYWILDSDYKKYALVWSCYNSIIGHRESAQIMSRTPKLDRESMDLIRAKVQALGLDAGFAKVSQSGCKSWDELGNPIISYNKRHHALMGVAHKNKKKRY
ncbi:Apolipoprotein D [Halotydeus destructor]|nr:Apolipoprotein D [Halotydeus destructor]